VTIADDIAFLEDFRARILKFLVDGAAPSLDPVWGGKGIFQMDEGMKDPAFRQQRQDLNRMKGRAAAIVEGAGVSCTLIQYPPPAAGGQIIRRPLFDLITDNRTPHTLDGGLFTGKVDEAIGLLQARVADIAAAMPVLPVTDIDAALVFYESIAGFRGRDRGEGYAVVERGAARIMLRAVASNPASVLLETPDVDATQADIASRGGAVQSAAIAGRDGFSVTDPDGNSLYFTGSG
jgi:predicted enzyme related to lactoylglutathione lyase